MIKEAKRWLRQAEADLKAANDSAKDGNYEWSCFQAQQGAEKSLKAYLYSLGYTSFTTHSIKLLVKECRKKEKEFAQLEEAARILDAYYIPTRYPNGLDEDIAPVDYYDKEDAERCLSYATLTLTVVKRFIRN
ncbi:MAG: HEPN domain-containing protein [bacterium]